MDQNVGFLTVLREPNGFLGGYLVTNVWGRPLEFRLSSAVHPNRLQEILYGRTLEAYLCADLIGRALVEKATMTAACIFTDLRAVLDLRRRLEVPMVWLPRTEEDADVPSAYPEVGPGRCHPQFAGDVVIVRLMVERLAGNLDLAEPFARIRDAITEARKIGATSRD